MGHMVSVVAAEQSVSQVVRLQGKNLNIVMVPHRRGQSAALDSFCAERRQLVDIVRDLKPDLVHGHWTHTGHALAALDSCYPCLITIHDAALTCAWLSRHYRPDLLLRLFKHLADTRIVVRRSCNLIAVSSYVEEHVRRCFGYRGDLRVIPNAVPDALFDSPVETRRIRSHDRLTFASNGAWGRLKNISTLLHAFSLVIRSMPSARLVLIGTGLGPGGSAQMWAQRRNMAQGVTFAGVLDYDVVQSILRDEVDILVHPSRTEACNMAIAEALALGIPVIAGHVGGIPWMLKEGACGELIDIESPQALAVAMLRLAGDAERRNTLAEAGVAWADQCFKADHVAQQHVEYYQHILGQHEKSTAPLK
jgi:L-malate glycosyltransferase